MFLGGKNFRPGFDNRSRIIFECLCKKLQVGLILKKERMLSLMIL